MTVKKTHGKRKQLQSGVSNNSPSPSSLNRHLCMASYETGILSWNANDGKEKPWKVVFHETNLHLLEILKLNSYPKVI